MDTPSTDDHTRATPSTAVPSTGDAVGSTERPAVDQGASGSSQVPSSERRDDDIAALTATTKGLRHFQRYTYWSLIVAVIFLLVFPSLTGPVPLPPAPMGTTSLVGALITGLAVVKLTGHHIPPRPEKGRLTAAARASWLGIGGVGALAHGAANLIAGDRFLWIFGVGMILSFGLLDLRRRWRRIVSWVAPVLAGAIAAAGSELLGDEVPAANIVTTVLVTVFAIGLTLATVWSWQVVAQLDEARRTAATLAVANERLRFAADLHDIQGHNLQVIALKSELASRLLERDTSAAQREITEVQELAADALRDTRAVVQGYRRTTLDSEVANAATVLDSAGIRADVNVEEGASARLSEEARHVLGLFVREAVTNVLRHSVARHASIELRTDGGVTLTVRNDGREASSGSAGHRTRSGGRTTSGDGATSGDASPERRGGLHDLADRLRDAGGSLTWTADGDRFEVRAQLPLDPAEAAPGGAT